MTQQKQNSKVFEMDKFHLEMQSSINNVLDITSRIDERLKILYEKDDEYRENFQKLFGDISEILQRLATNDALMPNIVDDLNNLKEKVHELEIKMSNVHSSMKDHDDKWSKMVDWIFKIVLTGLSIYAAYMLQQK
jgi:chromosome segregation ATPase